jgi:hypothetical protein
MTKSSTNGTNVKDNRWNIEGGAEQVARLLVSLMAFW